jgi:hypothetical protein
MSAAMLRCIDCDCRYDLSATKAVCRFPAVLSYLSFATFVGAIGAFVVAWLQRRRARKMAE